MPEEHPRVTVGVESAKATREAAAWHAGQAVRLGSFPQTVAGWEALRDAVGRRAVVPAGRRGGQARRAAPRERGPGAGRARAGTNGGLRTGLRALGASAARWAGASAHSGARAGLGAQPGSGQGLRAKTDRQDALLVARLGASAQPALSVWQPLASAVSALEQRHAAARRSGRLAPARAAPR
jgi:hypothetical protein